MPHSTGLSDHERSAGVRAGAAQARGPPAVRGPYLTTAEAAAYLKTSESHFRALVRAGKVTKPIRPYGPTGKCLFSQPQLDDFMHASAVEQGVIPSNAA
jgi:excisionase family DNA binding protein